MHQLSKRAEAYLGRLHREREWFCEREKVAGFLEKQNLPLMKPVVRFEAYYSGLDLTIKCRPSETFFLRLFSVDDINEDTEILYLENHGTKLFDCGYHKTAQYNFYINENGQIVVEITDDYYLVLYSSAEIMLEVYAFLDSLGENVYTTFVYRVPELDDLLLSLMYQGFKEVRDCCDEHNHILQKDSLVAYCMPYWSDEHGMCLQVYGTDKDKCDQLIASLSKDKLIQ